MHAAEYEAVLVQWLAMAVHCASCSHVTISQDEHTGPCHGVLLGTCCVKHVKKTQKWRPLHADACLPGDGANKGIALVLASPAKNAETLPHALGPPNSTSLVKLIPSFSVVVD